MPFKDQEYDIVFSNAVVEHIPNGQGQRLYVEELLRVGRRVFITTPNYWYPVELHSRLPLIHFLPAGLRTPLLRRIRDEWWVNFYNQELRLLTPRRFKSLFQTSRPVRIVKQCITFYPETLIALVGG